MTAAPQPSAVCLTKGTSSHTPAACSEHAGETQASKNTRAAPSTMLRLSVARYLLVDFQRTANATIKTATMIKIIHNRSRSESLPAAKSFCARRDFSASFARSASLSWEMA